MHQNRQTHFLTKRVHLPMLRVVNSEFLNIRMKLHTVESEFQYLRNIFFHIRTLRMKRSQARQFTAAVFYGLSYKLVY